MKQRINRICIYLVFGLSLFAMLLVGGATVLAQLGLFSPAPGGDEGTAAHLFQLAIVLLFPSGLGFIVTADWRRPITVVKELVIPVGAVLAAFSTLFYIEHLMR